MYFRRFFKMNEAGEGDGGTGGGNSESTGVLSGGGDTGDMSADTAVDSGTSAQVDIVFPENWKDAIAEEYRSEPALANVPDIPTLVKNYIHAQKNMGKKGVHLPDKHSTDDDRRSFFQQMGLPAQFEEYEVSMPDGAEFEDGFITAFKQAAFDANILPEQSSKLLAWYNKANAETMDRMVTQNKLEMQEELKALKQEWGADYADKVNKAQSVLRTAGLEQVNKWLSETGLDNSSMMIRLMAQIGELMKEDGVIDLGHNVGPSGKEIQQRIQELEGNTDGPLYDKRHPNHQAAVKERQHLYEQLYPGQ